MHRSWNLFVVAMMLAVPVRSLAQHEHDHAHPVPEKFGSVHFPTSCKAEVAPAFDRAVALLHSFAYPEAGKAFGDIAANDPDCAMAEWGVAMS